MVKRRLTEYDRIRIVRVMERTFNATAAKNALAKEGICVDRKTVQNTWERYQDNNSVEYIKPPGRPNLYRKIREYIDVKMTENNESTAGELSAMIYRDMDLLVPARTIARIRRKIGWRHVSVKYAQMVREANRLPRVKFSEDIVNGHRRFDNVIFSDECTVQLESNRRRCFIKNNCKLMAIRSRAKHPVKLHIWAGISSQGATTLAFFDGKIRMDSRFYCKIIRDFYLPFKNKWTERNHTTCYLQQDNDPKHRSKYTTAWFQENNVPVIWWPSESPDLNPIETLWHQLKEFLRGVAKPTNKAELINGVRQFWKSRLTIDQCKRYCEHIYNVAPLVVAASGGPTLK